MPKSYSDKLKDPRWQKRRLEILNRDKFSCQRCNGSNSELHVHHRAYRKGLEPWDYSNDELVTLCKECHKFTEERFRELNTAFGSQFEREKVLNLVFMISESLTIERSKPDFDPTRVLIRCLAWCNNFLLQECKDSQ